MPNPENLKKRKPFTKNDPRINKEGRPKKLPEIDQLLADVLGEDGKGNIAAKSILIALHKRAMKGDVRAAEVLLDRAYGKAKQSIDINKQELEVTIIPKEPR